MKKLLIIIILFIPSTASAEWFSWDKTNTKLNVPLTLLIIADLGQTLSIADNCTYYPIEDGYAWDQSETNNVLGRCPTRTQVKQYFAMSYLVIAGLTYILPPEWSHGFQTGIITMEVIVVNRNYNLKIGVKF